MNDFKDFSDLEFDEADNAFHIHKSTTEAKFVQMYHQRNAILSMLKLILPSIQINMKADQFIEP